VGDTIERNKTEEVGIREEAKERKRGKEGRKER
jgi:hypothetical protein